MVLDMRHLDLFQPASMQTMNLKINHFLMQSFFLLKSSKIVRFWKAVVKPLSTYMKDYTVFFKNEFDRNNFKWLNIILIHVKINILKKILQKMLYICERIHSKNGIPFEKKNVSTISFWHFWHWQKFSSYLETRMEIPHFLKTRCDDRELFHKSICTYVTFEDFS